MTMLARAGRLALDLLYPPRCALCTRNGTLLCDECIAELPRADGERCDVCWKPLLLPWPCSCADGPLAFGKLRSALKYKDSVRRLVLSFKFAGQSALAERLAVPLVETFTAEALSADVIVPVPLTGLGRRLRGYNQASLLANELSRSTGTPCDEVLSRLRSVRQQARSASAEERRRNVIGAFAVRRAGAVAGRSVLLIDDVATTGATLDACARELLKAGASSVSALTLARED